MILDQEKEEEREEMAARTDTANPTRRAAEDQTHAPDLDLKERIEIDPNHQNQEVTIRGCSI